MFPLLKKKLTPEQCAHSLAQTLSDALKSVESDPLLRKTDVDIEVIMGELLYLIAFAIEYGTAIHLGDSAERDAVLKHFSSLFVKYGAKEGYEAEFMGSMNTRHDRYFAAMGTKVEEITDSVGAEFARFCGYDNDITVISCGQIEFIGFLKGVEALFDKCLVEL